MSRNRGRAPSPVAPAATQVKDAIVRWTGDVKQTTQRIRSDAEHLKELGAQANEGVRRAGEALEAGIGQLFEGIAKQVSIKLDEFEQRLGKRK